jgi:hypothetical protein
VWWRQKGVLSTAHLILSVGGLPALVELDVESIVLQYVYGEFRRLLPLHAVLAASGWPPYLSKLHGSLNPLLVNLITLLDAMGRPWPLIRNGRTEWLKF